MCRQLAQSNLDLKTSFSTDSRNDGSKMNFVLFICQSNKNYYASKKQQFSISLIATYALCVATFCVL
jgi:hypothetical protein